MNIQEIQTRKEGQTFDCKSIQIEPKALGLIRRVGPDKGGFWEIIE